MRVAARLKIPFITMDFEKEYRAKVVEYLFREYKKGRTPNPDVLCNRYIKFGMLLREAKKLGFSKVATGHYAGVSYDGKKYHLQRAADEKKDQTYFLHQLTQAQLKHILFPLQSLTKPQIRDLAHKFNLPTADRKESMGICFIGPRAMKDFLGARIKHKPGPIVVQATGEKIGEHDGLAFYTLGQRHGFIKKGSDRALYIIGKDKKTNTLLVGDEHSPLLHTTTITVAKPHWILGKPAFPFKCLARYVHAQALQEVTVSATLKGVTVSFEKPQRTPTPGQFVVFYNDNDCLGGGEIE
jgi:tRNA-specific 2-thiouridylase